MKPLGVKISPRPTSGAARVDIYVYSGGSGAGSGMGGQKWEAAIVHRPRLAIELFNPALDGKTQIGRGDLVLNLNRIRQVSMSKAYYWLGAPITIYDASDADLTSAPVEFTGYVKSTSYDVSTDQLTLNFEVGANALDRPLLFNEFTGGGGILGDAQLRGTLQPAGFGTVQNVEPVWFDNTNNIGMIDGYGNCTAITALFEGGNDFGASVGDYATYALLLAAITGGAIKPGRWGTCIAQGLVGLGAPPVKPITVDATFGTNRPGAFMQRVLQTHALISVGSIDTAAFTALDTAVNRATHYWTADQRTCRDLLESIAASCNASPLVTFQGKYSVTRAFGGSTALTIYKQAPTRATRVTKWNALDPDVPTWRMRARAARPGTTLTIDQINYADDLIDRGIYSSSTVYRQGNLVWGPDGAQYVFINALAQSTAPLPVPPATSNAYWSQTRPPITAADLEYVDGTPIEYLKPAQPNADVTGTNAAVGDANRVRFPKMEKDTVGYVGGSAGGTPTISSFTAFHNDGDGLWLQGSFTAATQTVSIWTAGPVLPAGNVAYRIPVTPGERLYARALFNVSTIPAAGRYYLWCEFFNDAGTNLGSSFASTVIATGVSGGWVELWAFSTSNVPAGATYMLLGARMENQGAGTATGAFSLAMKEPMVCSAGSTQTARPRFNAVVTSEPGAEVTRKIDGPPQSLTFAYDYTGAKSGWTSRDLTFKVLDSSGQVVTNVTMTAKVKQGGYNTLNTSSAAVNLSMSSGTGTLTVNSVETDTGSIGINALANGVAVPPLTINFARDNGSPPATTGGSGPVTLQTVTTGFPSFNSTTHVSEATVSGTVPAGKNQCNISVNLVATPAGGSGYAGSVNCRVMRDNGGGSFTQIGSTVTLSTWYTPPTGGEPADIGAAAFSFTVNDGSRTAGVAYSYIVEMWDTSGTRSHTVAAATGAGGGVTLTAS